MVLTTGTPPKRSKKLVDLICKANRKLEEGLGSSILLLAASVSLLLANLPATSTSWLAYWDQTIGPMIGGHALSRQDWVNEGLMALFFFSVGLEVKKELVEGSLASPKKAALPCVAALGGMVVPMLVYFVSQFLAPGGSLAGITVPMATDIAFAMGVFRVFRNRMPQSAGPFLLALATADDIGAIAVIAVCFAHHVNVTYLALAALVLVSAAFVGYRQEAGSSRALALPGIGLWYCLLRGGVNADIAGVLTACCVPVRTERGGQILERLLERWTLVCSVIILPLFGLANCAVPLAGKEGLAGHMAGHIAVPLGVLGGLVIGKPLGIVGFSYASMRMGITSLPPDMTRRHLCILGMLGSVGFTMCLFLIENALTGHTAQLSKIAVFMGSGFGALGSSMAMSQLKRSFCDRESSMAKA